MAGLKSSTARIQALDLEPERPVSFLQSATINPVKLLQQDAHAAQVHDAQNASTSYLVRKLHGRRNSSFGFLRKRFVLTVLCDKGMPCAIMTTPLKEFQDWMKIRMIPSAKIDRLQAIYAKAGSNKEVLRDWPYKFPPRDARARLIAASKFESLMYVDLVEIDTAAPDTLRITFEKHHDGQLRKSKEFEFRPEPYVKPDAEKQCQEACNVIRCGMLNAFLLRPVMVDRPLKAGDIGVWCERVKTDVNAPNAYGKTNLHHHVQLRANGQEAKVQKLLEWGADPNVVYGPTKMTPLHMAASWHQPQIVTSLLEHGADATRPDVNGLTPLHCAVVYGDPASVKSIVQKAGVNFDLNAMIPTVRGDMNLLDCALECEAPEAVITNIWNFLADSGADRVGVRDILVYPPPFPVLRVPRIVAMVLLSCRHRWQTRVDETGNLATTFQIGSESADDLRKLQILLNVGTAPDQTDAFGRTPLCLCTSGDLTARLLRHGANPRVCAPTASVERYASAYVGVAYMGTIADQADKLRQSKYNTADGLEPSLELLARRMAAVQAQFAVDLRNVYIRAMCTQSPVLEALAEGKVDKAKILFDNGGSCFVCTEAISLRHLNMAVLLAEKSAEYRRFETVFGQYVWNKLAMGILRFDDLPIEAPRFYGSQLLGASYARSNAWKGLNLPQHQAMEATYTSLLRRCTEAERAHGVTDAHYATLRDGPTAAELAASERKVMAILSAIYANPASRLLEEAGISGGVAQHRRSVAEDARPISGINNFDSDDDVFGPSLSQSPTASPTRRQRRSSSGSMRCASVESGDGFESLWLEDGDGAAEELDAAASVCQMEAALRDSRGQSMIDEGEGWDEYRDRTITLSVYDGFDDV
eukprot:m.1061649 g.1061649  ORF g.1061649 m.1061649 type:complete len:871 (+) comp24212_c0_seq22:365-2977(+)